jgi:excisionase family DNA binding protein
VAELPTNPAELLTKDEVAKYLNVSVDTLDRMIDEGDFPGPTKIGKQSRYRWGTVDEFLKALALVQEVKRKGDGGGQISAAAGKSTAAAGKSTATEDATEKPPSKPDKQR